MNDICRRPTANIIFTLTAFPLALGTKPGCPLSPLPFNTVPDVLAKEVSRKKKEKASRLEGKK